MSNLSQTCGVVGWEVAHIYCDNCGDFFVHRYCLDKMPPTFDEYVFWLCEDCKPDAKSSPPLPEVQSQKPPLEIDHVRPQTAQPIIDPIWRGSLTIVDLKRYSSYRIVAHLSQMACPRVCEEEKLFPESLSCQLTSRLSVWPKGFPQGGPKDDHIDIGLYFFTEDGIDRQAFDGLLGEMVPGGLALKAVVANDELLIFSSTKLPHGDRRFQGKLYLWGVFRAKQAGENAPG